MTCRPCKVADASGAVELVCLNGLAIPLATPQAMLIVLFPTVQYFGVSVMIIPLLSFVLLIYRINFTL